MSQSVAILFGRLQWESLETGTFEMGEWGARVCDDTVTECIYCVLRFNTGKVVVLLRNAANRNHAISWMLVFSMLIYFTCQPLRLGLMVSLLPCMQKSLRNMPSPVQLGLRHSYPFYYHPVLELFSGLVV